MNFIEKINISNYKCFKNFSLTLNEGVNIIVGNNEAGKSTILEAIHLALSGLLNGRYLRYELTQYLFNKDVETEYLESLKTDTPLQLPKISIEVFFSGEELPLFEGDNNSLKSKASGVILNIEFDEEYKDSYEELLKSEMTTIPIEFYKVSWTSFGRGKVSARNIPMKSVLIDSSRTRYQNGSDVYLSKIIKDDLLEKDLVDLSQAYRNLKQTFMRDKSVGDINKRITSKADISSKKVSVSVDLSAKNSWETSLMTYLDEIPFHQIGKGEQIIIKTNLALAHKEAIKSNLVLIEEPENHLSHSKLNRLISNIQKKCEGKQILITTHSSFVANKLNIKNLIILENQKGKSPLAELKKDTYEFFEKLPGFEILRLILCYKAILVEGPSDELIVQRAFIDNQGFLPIEKEIDVISVRGITFDRFLQIAELIEKQVAVVTDNDGNYNTKVIKKYKGYDDTENIEIFADSRDEYKSLEPQIVDANKNNLETFCDVIGIDMSEYNSVELIITYMEKHKTECALKIFSSEKMIEYPDYIKRVIDWSNGE